MTNPNLKTQIAQHLAFEVVCNVRMLRLLRNSLILLALIGFVYPPKIYAGDNINPVVSVSAWDSQCGKGADIKHGCDEVRSRTIVDASKYPWSAIGRVNFAGYRSKKHCTGALIGERLVLTAAHCLYDRHRNKWLEAERVHFVAGYQRGDNVAHSTAKQYYVSSVHDVTSGSFRYIPHKDWALLELNTPVGLKAGYLWWPSFPYVKGEHVVEAGGNIMFAGYPAVRKHVLSVDMDCGRINLRNNDTLLSHECSTMSGDSGGPVLLLKDGKAMIVAVHSGVANAQGKIVQLSVPVASFYKGFMEAGGNNASIKNGIAGIGATGQPPQ